MAGFTPNLEDTISVMERKGYKVFRNENGFDLNIVGIRTRELQANRFDDFMTVFYRMNGEWIFNVFKCTTDPGAYWLNNPERMSALGTAILKEGQYSRAHRLGKHRGQYAALVQNSPLTVIRDANRDSVLDLDSGREETGMFGINIHRASAKHESVQVDRWSAGCQVLCDPFQYEFFLKLCRQGREAFGNSFTYTLLNESDFA
ncbi:MAG: hypothetical protein Kow0042_15900 [Calditrichia bacterium]